MNWKFWKRKKKSKPKQITVTNLDDATNIQDERKDYVEFCMNKLGCDTFFLIALDSDEANQGLGFTIMSGMKGDLNLLVFAMCNIIGQNPIFCKHMLYELARHNIGDETRSEKTTNS